MIHCQQCIGGEPRIDLHDCFTRPLDYLVNPRMDAVGDGPLHRASIFDRFRLLLNIHEIAGSEVAEFFERFPLPELGTSRISLLSGPHLSTGSCDIGLGLISSFAAEIWWSRSKVECRLLNRLPHRRPSFALTE